MPSTEGRTTHARTPVRPIAVLDADVLVPRGLRDLLLSCADQSVFRPLRQVEIENEVRRIGARLNMRRRGVSQAQADAAIDHALSRMNAAFPDARLSTKAWVPLVPAMMNHTKDRHVLAAALGGEATRVVTSNMRDFPVRTRPAGIAVQRPDAFLLDRLTSTPGLVVAAVEAMGARHQRPAHTSRQLADMLAQGRHVPRFGAALRELL